MNKLLFLVCVTAVIVAGCQSTAIDHKQDLQSTRAAENIKANVFLKRLFRNH